MLSSSQSTVTAGKKVTSKKESRGGGMAESTEDDCVWKRPPTHQRQRIWRYALIDRQHRPKNLPFLSSLSVPAIRPVSLRVVLSCGFFRFLYRRILLPSPTETVFASGLRTRTVPKPEHGVRGSRRRETEGGGGRGCRGSSWNS